MKARDAARATGVILASAALAALATAALSGGPEDSRQEETVPAATRPSGLERCRVLGEAGSRDPDCTAAWADQRRRFFGSDRPSAGETRP